MQTLTQTETRVVQLIDDASRMVGSAYKLAKLIGYSRAEVSMWRMLRRPCPLEAQILMADLAQRDVNTVIKDAVIERNANTPRGEKLVTALGKGLMVATGATTITLSASDASASSAIVLVDLLRCILC